MNELPTIRLEIEGMKFAIMSHLTTYHKGVESAVFNAIEKAIKNLDIAAMVQQEVNTAVGKSIKSYFEYGPGQKALQDSVWASLLGDDKEENQ